MAISITPTPAVPVPPATSQQVIVQVFSVLATDTINNPVRYTLGDIIERTVVYSGTTIVSEVWKNLSTGATLPGAPRGTDIVAKPSTALTDTELRAAPVEVYVTNQPTPAPAATALQFYSDSFIAQANDAVNSQFVAGDVLSRETIIDISTGTVQSTVWKNLTQSTVLTVAPALTSIAAAPSTALTNAELRAAAVHVIVDNQVELSPTAPITQIETIVTTYAAKQNPTLPGLLYVKGDILQLTEVIDNSVPTAPVILSAIWKNITQDTDNVSVNSADITILPSTGLTNTELRATPINVYNSDYEYEMYVANADGTGYSKGDIIRRETKVVFGSTDTVTETWSNVTLNTVLASVDRTHLALSAEKQGYSTETLNYVATQNDAVNSEYSEDDELQRTVQWNNTLVPAVAIGETWFNVTTGVTLSATPLQTHYRIYSGAPSTMENSITNMSTQTFGVIPPGAYQIAVANLGYTDGMVQGSKIPSGVSFEFTADAGDYLGQMTYDATGTEFLITIVQSTAAGPITPIVNAPIIISPTSGAVNQETSVTLTSSAFSGFGPVGTHVSSDWEVYAEAADVGVGTPIASVTGSVASITTFALTSLTNGEDYFARVRHNSSSGLTSAWSMVSSFNVKNVPTVAAPVWSMNSYFTDASGNNPLTSTLIRSSTRKALGLTLNAFSGTNGPGLMKDIVFEFATDAAFTNIVKTVTVADGSTKFVEPLNGTDLPPADVTYKVRAKRVSTTGIVSPWTAAQDLYIKPFTFMGWARGSLKVVIGDVYPGAKVSFLGANPDFEVNVVSGQVIDVNTAAYGNGLFEMTGVRSFKHMYDSSTQLEVVQWGDTRWTSLESAFDVTYYNANPAADPPQTTFAIIFNTSGSWILGATVQDLPSLVNCTSMKRMFYTSYAPVQFRMAEWDTSNITNMQEMFAYSGFGSIGSALNSWNVSKVTNFSGMFRRSYPPDTFSLSNWNTSAATNMSSMFRDISPFNMTSFAASLPASFTNWNVSNVTNMSYMFCSTFTSSAWDIPTLAGWNVSNVTDMSYMFQNASPTFSFVGWNTAKVANFEGMFYNSWIYRTGVNDSTPYPVTGMEALVTAAATNMKLMFSGANGLMNVDVSGWNVSNVTNMNSTFRATVLSNTTRQSFSTWNTAKVTDMAQMFNWNRSSGPLNIANWNTSKVVTFAGMFGAYSDYKMTADLSAWNTSSATNMSEMFDVFTGFSNTTDQGFNPGNIANWDTSNVTNMYAMFSDNEVFNADLSGWCVGSIPTEPGNFKTGATAWVLPKPVWGTCPP